MSNSIFKGPVELPCPLLTEGAAGGVYLPGNIVARNGADLDGADASTAGQLLIAKEMGPGVGGRVDTAFAAGEPVLAYVARQGLIFAARVTTGQALVSGETLLERGANGRLVVLASGVAVAVAKQTITITTNDQLVEVEIL